MTLHSAASISRSSLSAGGGPFRIGDTSKREQLAQKMAVKARRSLSVKAGSSSGGSGSKSGGSGLRRRVLDSVRGHGAGEGTPRSPRGGDLSPAAKTLLGRTGQGKALEKGLATSDGWEAQDLARVERARVRARELESREKIKRARWTPSPAPSLGFDPDLPDR